MRSFHLTLAVVAGLLCAAATGLWMASRQSRLGVRGGPLQVHVQEGVASFCVYSYEYYRGWGPFWYHSRAIFVELIDDNEHVDFGSPEEMHDFFAEARGAPNEGPGSSFLGFAARHWDNGRHSATYIMVPCWFFMLAFGVAAQLAMRRYRRLRRSGPGHCPSCGYDLRASPRRCPECGAQAAGLGGT